MNKRQKILIVDDAKFNRDTDAAEDQRKGNGIPEISGVSGK